MIAAYPVPVADVDLSNKMSSKAATQLKQAWKVVTTPEAIAEASSRPGAIFGETQEAVCERIDRRLRAPVGSTYCKAFTRYNSDYTNSERFETVLAEYPYPILLKPAEKLPLTEGKRSQPYWYSKDEGKEQDNAKLWLQAGRIAKTKGGCIVDALYDYRNEPKRVDPKTDELLVERSGLGVSLLYDPDRVKRLIKNRSAKEKRKKSGSVKAKTGLESIYTPKDLMAQCIKAMFDRIWYSELGEFYSRPDHNWCQWNWRARSLGDSIITTHKLAIRLGELERIRGEVYAAWFPPILKRRKALKGLTVNDEFFYLVESELAAMAKIKETDSVTDED